MKVLLLGAGGMLAHDLINEFTDQELVLGDLPDFDLLKFFELEKQIIHIRPDFIINAAAYTKVDSCESDKEACLAINGQAVGNLAKISKKVNATLIHYSTDYVFNGRKSEGYAETDAPDPINAYGQSKAVGEKYLQQTLDNFYLIRTAWLYGPNGKNFVDTIIDLSLKQDTIEVVSDQFGNPTFTRDLAKATKKILIDKKPYGIYHQTNAGACSWYDFALKIKEIKSFASKIMPVDSAQMPRPANRPKYSILQNTKLPGLRPWQEALTEYLS